MSDQFTHAPRSTAEPAAVGQYESIRCAEAPMEAECRQGDTRIEYTGTEECPIAREVAHDESVVTGATVGAGIARTRCEACVGHDEGTARQVSNDT